MAIYTTENIKSYRRPAEILELVEAFERCTLPVEAWNGETFLTLAFWYLYLNPVAEAERLMCESAARCNFENGSNVNSFVLPAKARRARLLTAMNDFIKIHKSEKSFVALANLVLRRFAGQSIGLEVRRRAFEFYSNPVMNSRTREALEQ